MTVTAVLLNATQYRLFYNLNHDGNAGDSLLITNATLLAGAASSPLLQELLNTDRADNAAAALAMLTTPGLSDIVNTSGAVDPQPWAIDWTIDGQQRVQCTVRGTPGNTFSARPR